MNFYSCQSNLLIMLNLVSTTKKNEDLIENILRSASKMLPWLSNLTYEERPAKIEIPSMKYRRMHGDMIIVYRLQNGYEPLLEHLFEVDNNSITRGHNFKLKKSPFKTTIHQHFFIKHVVNNWNSLLFCRQRNFH